MLHLEVHQQYLCYAVLHLEVHPYHLLRSALLGSPPVLSITRCFAWKSTAIFVTSASLRSIHPPTDCAFGIHCQECSWLFLSHMLELEKEKIVLVNADWLCLIGDRAWEHCHIRPPVGLCCSHIKLRLTATQCYRGNFVLTTMRTCCFTQR